MEEDYTYVPNKIFDALVKKKLLQPIGGSYPGYYLVNCDHDNYLVNRSSHSRPNLNLTMQFDDKRIVFEAQDFLWKTYPCAVSLLPFRKLATPDNSRAPSFVFGYWVWKKLCIAFNYTDNTIGLGFPSN